MTNSVLKVSIVSISLFYAIMAIVGVWFGTHTNIPEYKEMFETFKSISLLIVAIPAAWLTFCFQRRVSQIQQLRVFWKYLAESVQDAIQYTHSDSGQPPDQAAFGQVMKRLSICTDDMRCVFKNIKESSPFTDPEISQYVYNVKQCKTADDLKELVPYKLYADNTGLYPFESLKQIQKCIILLGYGRTYTPERARIARNHIVALWGVLRAALLREFDRAQPRFPETPFKP